MLTTDTRLQDRYRIVRPFGEGGQGAVYEAFDERLKIPVALKQIFCTDARSLTAFEREALMLARLKHDALPRVIDHFSENGGQFLVMELILGDDLYELLQKQGVPFPTEDVIVWGRQLLDVLEYLHTLQPPIVHRDIKPQNLKLDSRGRIVLLDFGLAKDTMASAVLRGYSHYYAPLEQKRMRGTDARSDLYAFGATLYHLLTGQLPSDAEIRDEAIGNGQADPLTPVNLLNPQVSAPIAALIAQAMSLHRDDRPASAAAMREQLITASRPDSRKSPSLVHDSQKPTQIAEEPDNPEQFVFPKAGQPKAVPASSLKPKPLPANSFQEDTNRPKFPLIAAISAVILAAALGGWYWMDARKEQKQSDAKSLTASVVPLPIATPVEVMRYWLEVFDKNGKSSRVTQMAELTGGQSLKFHFLPRQPGSLYIIAPGAKNTPTTFLTSIPAPRTGVRSNLLTAGSEWEFPGGEGNQIGLNTELVEHPFTIIFSPQPLAEPDFLSALAMRPLNVEEQRAMESWRKQFSARTPDISTADGQHPAAIVNALPEQLGREPLVFDIKIKRQ